MARANPELIGAFRRTAERLSGDVSYQWGHMRTWVDLLEQSILQPECTFA
ncbi:MAG TPA: hypothetical protein VGA10_03115 [Thermoanaerobaculia bacterium]